MPRRCAPRNDGAGWTALFGTVPPSATPPPSLRAKRGNPVRAGNTEAYGLPRRYAPRNDGAGWTALFGTVPPSATPPPSLRAKRGNPVRAGNTEAYGLPRRYAPRNDGAGWTALFGTVPPSATPTPVIASAARQSSARRRHRGPWIATSLRSPQCRRRRWLRSGSPSGYSCPHASGQTPC